MFENKIKNWTYKVLTLGGRLVLIKSILTGLAVYWFALARCLRSILNSLSSSIFTFLWRKFGWSSAISLGELEYRFIPYQIRWLGHKELRMVWDLSRTEEYVAASNGEWYLESVHCT